MGIFRRIVRRAREGFPVIGAVVKKVVVGASNARPVDRTVEAAVGAPALALIRKAVAAGVGVLLGKLYGLIGWDLSFMNAEFTEWAVAAVVTIYLTWRVPNARAA
jgi:hypothetical protein